MMNLQKAQRLFATILLIIFGGIVIHAPLSVGFGALWPEAELLIKSWKEILIVLAFPLGLWLVIKNKNRADLFKDHLIILILVYSLLHIMLAVALTMGVTATLAGLVIDLRYLVFFVYVFTLLKMAPSYRSWFVRVMVAGAVIVVGFGVLQLFLPADILAHIGYGESTIMPYQTVDKNPDYIRINSTLRGPNPLGAYLVVVLGVVSAVIARSRFNLTDRRVLAGFLAFIVGTLAVLWFSYSRSALGAAGLAVVLVGAVAMRHIISHRAWIAGAVVVFALVGGVVAGRDHSVVSNVIFHENQDSGSAVTSDQDRLESLASGFDRLVNQPIGGGIGSTGSASLMGDAPLIIENQYLFVAHESGWLGLLLFLMIIGVVFTRLWRLRKDWLALGVMASGVGLLVIGLVLPVWADDTVSIIWWGLAAVALGATRSTELSGESSE